MTPSGDGRYSTGTKVSNTRETSPTCGPGNGDYVLIPLLSATKSIPLS
ncbi:hypothetical protein [Streptomyces sp. NPDC047071]